MRREGKGELVELRILIACLLSLRHAHGFVWNFGCFRTTPVTQTLPDD